MATGMKLGIVGRGVVGTALGRFLSTKGHYVCIYDKDPSRCHHSVEETLACDLVFICLPTPMSKTSYTCDVSAIEGFFAEHVKTGSRTSFVIRSTVYPGFTLNLCRTFKLLNTCYSPEFLTARSSLVDIAMPARNIIGTIGGHHPYALLQLYHILYPATPIFFTTAEEAETVKLACNSFSAVKVAFFNELFEFCGKKAMDFETIRQAMLAGGWIHPMHTQVPGPDGKNGFGGTCLPKDLANLIDCMDKAELNPWVCKSAYERNRFDREEGNRDV